MRAKLKDLVIEASTTKGEQVIYELPEKGEISVGRNRECDIFVPKEGYRNEALEVVARSVSRLHCSLHQRDGRLYVGKSVGRNGTYVNGEKIGEGEERELKHKDKLMLGQYELEVLIGEEDPDKLEVVSQ